MGNKNNFKTERECLQRCRTEGEQQLWIKRGKTTSGPIVFSVIYLISEHLQSQCDCVCICMNYMFSLWMINLLSSSRLVSSPQLCE